ncbi:MAG: DUF4783 domain-containing protein [Bacteroidetes bacterium]|jgi:hypothetical protein|nr:DUF4783 domain-containing protein [Bacteroidota bacterium]
MRYALLLICLPFVTPAEAQVRHSRNALRSATQERLVPSAQAQESLRVTVREFEKGLRAPSSASLASFMAPTVQLALPEMGRGDYSSNQALQLLTGFLSRRAVRDADIDRIEASVASPYASGTVVVSGEGRDTLRLYLSFATVDSRWLITHLSLY